MELFIHPLSPSRAADYLDFFDHRAFADGSPYYPCYCTAFQMTPAQIEREFLSQYAPTAAGVERVRLAMRRRAEQLIAQGRLQGYLAYDHGLSVGWCNANDKSSYVRVGEFDIFKADDGLFVPPAPASAPRIKSIVCFEIAPPYRGRGIASALLDRVCRDAQADGYDAVEAYPVARAAYEALDFTGPVRLYEAAGFLPAGQQGRLLVLRKALPGCPYPSTT